MVILKENVTGIFITIPLLGQNCYYLAAVLELPHMMRYPLSSSEHVNRDYCGVLVCFCMSMRFDNICIWSSKYFISNSILLDYFQVCHCQDLLLTRITQPMTHVNLDCYLAAHSKVLVIHVLKVIFVKPVHLIQPHVLLAPSITELVNHLVRHVHLVITVHREQFLMKITHAPVVIIVRKIRQTSINTLVEMGCLTTYRDKLI